MNILIKALSLFIFFAINDSSNIELEQNLIIGTEGDEIHFGNIQNIIVDDKGTIYVCDWNKDHIQVFNNKGELISKVGRLGQGPGEFEQLADINLSESGNLYALDINLVRLKIFNWKDNVSLKGSGSYLYLLDRPT